MVREERETKARNAIFSIRKALKQHQEMSLSNSQ